MYITCDSLFVQVMDAENRVVDSEMQAYQIYRLWTTQALSLLLWVMKELGRPRAISIKNFRGIKKPGSKVIELVVLV
ncbi:hypothetical protein CTI12_AA392150 [Artemisia annua]|uniref:Uncharacterized protein n=1 Tax=Artemisia annua TaxID=35608 RepID=A0A2U1MDG5_ARTAN|nr:hypothetical protein CTI12_AA392150 [Artemisia annua]